VTTYRHSYVWRLGSDPVSYLWTGVPKLRTPADDVDPSGAEWLGAGDLLRLPTLKLLINGIAQRVDFSLSGVSMEALRLALADKETVQGASLRIGRVDFDDDFQIVGSIHWEWIGIADVLSVESSGSENGRQRSITISAASSDTLRSNPNLSFFTAADQRKRSPDDQFCDFVGRITIGSTRRFGPK